MNPTHPNTILPFIFVIGVMAGMLFIRVTDVIETWGQPVNTTYRFSIEKPIEAKVQLEAITTCIDGPNCITKE